MNINILSIKRYENERQIKFSLDHDSNFIMWAVMFCDEFILNYIELNNLFINTEVSFNIIFVNQVRLVLDDKISIFTQERSNSCIYCIGIVKKILSEDSFICNITNIGEVTVNLEYDDTNIYEGMKVEFTGELEMNIMEELSILSDKNDFIL